MSLRLCGHLKEDGIPSGSPRDRRRAEVCDWKLPPLRTLRDIQKALQRIANELWSGRLDPERAGPCSTQRSKPRCHSEIGTNAKNERSKSLRMNTLAVSY